MERITVKDVRIMFARAARAAELVGLDPGRWIVTEGSKINGRAYRLHAVDPSTGGRSSVLGVDYLGMTARAAHAQLHAYALAWEAVAESQSQPRSSG